MDFQTEIVLLMVCCFFLGAVSALTAVYFYDHYVICNDECDELIEEEGI